MGDAVVPKDWDRIVSYYFQHYSATIERLFEENGHKIVVEQPAQLTESTAEKTT
jgi:hypothetical protein